MIPYNVPKYNTTLSHQCEIHPELVGHIALNPFLRFNSPSRIQMWASHLTQMPVIEKPTARMIRSCMEREYGQAAYSVRMPETGHIVEVIKRYRRGEDISSIPDNEASTIVIFQEHHGSEMIDYFELKGHHFEHSHFGFQYRKTEAYGRIGKNEPFEKGEAFLVSPNLQDNGDYIFGKDARVAHMTHPCVSEDGIGICRDVLEDFAVRTYEKRDISFGSRMIPLNIHPDNFGRYGCIPEIGSIIPESGRVMTLRRDITDEKSIKVKGQRFDDVSMGLVRKSVKGLKTVCNYFDQTTYAKPGGRVVDIKVFHDESVAASMPPEFEAQLKRYYNATCDYYRRLLAVEKMLRDRYRDNLDVKLSKELSGLFAEAYGYLNTENAAKEKVQKIYRNDPMDRWRVEITIEYRVIPTYGSKFTGISGDKGVICHILEPHEMPVDSRGRRADFIVDPGSSISRMNVGRDYEPYFTAAAEDDRDRIIQMLGVSPTDPALEVILDEMEKNGDPRLEAAWIHALEFCDIFSPTLMFPALTGPEFEGTKAGYLASILREGFELAAPSDANTDYMKAVEVFESLPHHKPHFDNVHYRGYSGELVKTVNRFRMGRQTMIMLEKIGDDNMAVASSRRQHFGIPAPITNLDKHSRPLRVNSVKTIGETEQRILAAYIGPDATAEMMDRSNNPDTAKLVVEGILNAEQPTNIPLLVDRKVHGYGGSKPLMLVKHMLSTSGARFVYEPYVDPHADRHMANYKPQPL